MKLNDKFSLIPRLLDRTKATKGFLLLPMHILYHLESLGTRLQQAKWIYGQSVFNKTYKFPFSHIVKLKFEVYTAYN